MSEALPDQTKKQRLGRGLGSLLGTTSEEISPAINKISSAEVGQELRIWQIAVEKLSPSQFQPRVHFHKEALEELAASIKQNGILQPIVARKINANTIEIIAGERRWRAAQLAGLHEVPVILKNFNNKEALELAIIENIQREDLDPIEEAEAYHRLMTEFGLTQQSVSERVGKERATVANAMRLLALPQEIRRLVSERKISPGHAKVLLGIEDQQLQDTIAKKIIEKQLSVRALEKEAAIIKNNGRLKESRDAVAETPSAKLSTKRALFGLSEELQKLLGTKVLIEYKGGRGKLIVSFYSDEELSALIEKVKAGCKN